jgi:tripartite ATP-independent transporter DctP family solute receptor
MRKSCRMVLLLILLLLVSTAYTSAAGKYVIKLGLTNEPNHYHSIASLKFAEIVKRQTKGQVIVDVIAGQQLGTEQEMISQAEQGIIQMFNASPGSVGSYQKEYQVMLCPYIWRDYEHLRKTMEGPIGKEFADKLLESHKVRILDFLWVNGLRHLSTTNKAVYKPEDLKGMKIRAPQAPIYIAAVKALGGIPTPIDFSELYMALQQGVADGEENALGTIDSKKFYEVQKYVMLTGHIFQSQVVGISEVFYSKLPKKYQKVIVEAVKEAREYNNRLQLEADAKSLEKFKKLGVKIIQPDVEAFRANTAKYIKDLESLWGPGLYEKIINVK